MEVFSSHIEGNYLNSQMKQSITSYSRSSFKPRPKLWKCLRCWYFGKTFQKLPSMMVPLKHWLVFIIS